MSHGVSDTIQFIGRFHPVLVHLPIGFLLVLGALEALVLRPRFRHVAASSRVILVLTVPVTILSATCGWLLSWSDGYDADLLFWHRWTGTSLAVAVVVLLILHQRGKPAVYRSGLVATLVLLCVASHFGGTLTHGRGYLSNFAPGFLRPLLGAWRTDSPETRPPAGDPMTHPVYAAVIQPIFAESCVSCHGPNKSKGKLRLDSLENLLKGGDSGPVIVPGDVAQSLLLKRLRLPPEDEDHMPPDGKHQPSQNQIALLQWWVAAGAPTGQTLRELNPPASILSLLGSKTEHDAAQ